MTKERITISVDSDVAKRLRVTAIEKYHTLRSVGRLIEDMVKEQPDIDKIRSDREKYILEEIERYANMPKNALLCNEGDRFVICNTCGSTFTPTPGEATFCCACGGRDLRFMTNGDKTPWQRIQDNTPEMLAFKKELAEFP